MQTTLTFTFLPSFCITADISETTELWTFVLKVRKFEADKIMKSLFIALLNTNTLCLYFMVKFVEIHYDAWKPECNAQCVMFSHDALFLPAPRGKRGWKSFYAMLKGLVLYLQKVNTWTTFPSSPAVPYLPVCLFLTLWVNDLSQTERENTREEWSLFLFLTSFPLIWIWHHICSHNFLDKAFPHIEADDMLNTSVVLTPWWDSKLVKILRVLMH